MRTESGRNTNDEIKTAEDYRKERSERVGNRNYIYVHILIPAPNWELAPITN